MQRHGEIRRLFFNSCFARGAMFLLSADHAMVFLPHGGLSLGFVAFESVLSFFMFLSLVLPWPACPFLSSPLCYLVCAFSVLSFILVPVVLG